jgi:hypothetical protein
MDKPERIAARLLPRRVRWTSLGYDCWRGPYFVETCLHSKTIRGKVRAEQLIAVLGPRPFTPIAGSVLCFGGEDV